MFKSISHHAPLECRPQHVIQPLNMASLFKKHWISPEQLSLDGKLYNICSALNTQNVLFIPFSAMTLLAGFMIALSAEIGLRMGLLGSFMSMITTCACSPTFSLMQMNLSDSIVRVLKPMLAGLIPRFWS